MSAGEADRLAAVRRYRILDTEPEQRFDDLALLASQILRHADGPHQPYRRRAAVVQGPRRPRRHADAARRRVLRASDRTARPVRRDRRARRPAFPRQSVRQARAPYSPGPHVTGGLFETALFYVGQHMATAQMTGEAPEPMSVDRGPRRRAIYDLFTCKDGKQVFIGIASDGQWRRICSVMEMEDLVDDPRLKHNPGRLEHRQTLLERIGQAVAKLDSKDVVEMLASADVMCAPLNTPLTVLEDPHVMAEGRTLPLQIAKVAPAAAVAV